MQVLQFFFSATVGDAAMTTQRAAMQAASKQGVRRALWRATLARFRRDASEGPGGDEGIVGPLVRSDPDTLLRNKWTQ